MGVNFCWENYEQITGYQFSEIQFTIYKSQSFSLFMQSKTESNNEQDNANNHTNQHQDFYVENPMREKPRDRSPPKNFHYQQIMGSQLFFLRFN